jgi:putative ATPase
MPLANDLRPEKLSDIVGQDHLLGENGIITKMVKKDKILSMILFGPPGVGKTTLAYCLSQDTACDFKTLNATNAKVADIRKVVDCAESALKNGTKTILFIDEINRFSTSQQDALLPSVEDGTVLLIGATTENPQYSINKALLSRMQLYELKPLDKKAMVKMIIKVVNYYRNKGRLIKINQNVVNTLINKCNGDARKMITVMECVIELLMGDEQEITDDMLEVAMPGKHLYIDKSGSEHYSFAEEYQNAIQNSDADSAVFWLVKWVMSGGSSELKFITRRLMTTAAEDAALNPFALMSAVSADYIVERCGIPEGLIPLVLATIEIAKSPRDKVAMRALNLAKEDVITMNIFSTLKNKMLNGENHGDNYTKIDRTYVTGWDR